MTTIKKIVKPKETIRNNCTKKKENDTKNSIFDKSGPKFVGLICDFFSSMLVASYTVFNSVYFTN